MISINKKERVLATVSLKSTDKIPSSCRGLKNATKSLLKYFGIRDTDDFIIIKSLKMLKMD